MIDRKLKYVQGIASGIEDRERSSSSKLLANVNPTFSWVRLAQRVPVKIVLDEAPKMSWLLCLVLLQYILLKNKSLSFKLNKKHV